jgi:hypothetical protein
MLETIGHYRIKQKIGHGAMAVVYEGVVLYSNKGVAKLFEVSMPASRYA